LGNGIDALATVDGLDRHENAELRRDLNQQATVGRQKQSAC
jgi:hypothetical protein